MDLQTKPPLTVQAKKRNLTREDFVIGFNATGSDDLQQYFECVTRKGGRGQTPRTAAMVNLRRGGKLASTT
jgi:hypothetical protein